MLDSYAREFAFGTLRLWPAVSTAGIAELNHNTLPPGKHRASNDCDSD